MPVTVLRSRLPKSGPQIIKYRNCKNFSNEKFPSQIRKECEKFQSTLELDLFLNVGNNELNETAPLKQKCARGNI